MRSPPTKACSQQSRNSNTPLLFDDADFEQNESERAGQARRLAEDKALNDNAGIEERGGE